MGTAEGTPRPARFGLLLIVLIATYLFSAFTTGRWIAAAQAVFFVVVALLALRTASLGSRLGRIAAIAVLVGSAAAFPLALQSGSQTALGVTRIWATFLLLLAVVVLVRRVLSLSSVSVQSIYGALSAYLIIGFMFAACFAAVDYLAGDHFFANAQPSNTRTLQYFSFTTLTTLGYGDFTAAGNDGRAIAVLEALTGQVFLATLVARLVSAYGKPSREDDGPDATPKG